METIIVQSLEGIQKAAKDFLVAIGNHKIIAFEGGLGAGKTTFIKEICHQLGCRDQVSSPTFAIVNEYEIRDQKSGTILPIFHMDLYRLKDVEEAIQAGIEEYITGDYFCFIEWPEIIKQLLPGNTLFTIIEQNPENNQRKLSIFK